MTLKLPLQIGDQFPASSFAHTNYKALKRFDPRGGINQIATDTVLKKLAEIRELEPTLIDGVKSNAKALGYYVTGGAVGLGVFGAIGYGIYKMVEAQLSAETYWATYAVAISAEYLLEKVNCGLSNLSLAYVLAVHDTAKRAAKWSTKQDERTQDQKQLDAVNCREAICSQLKTVFDDCGKYLTEKAASIETIEKGAKFRQRLANFEKKFPHIEKMLAASGLPKDKISEVMQRLKDRVQLAKKESCELSASPLDKDRNLQILSLYKEEAVSDIAVPGDIQTRIEQARGQQMGRMEKVSGYVSALWSGVKTGLGASLGTAVVSQGLAYKYDLFPLVTSFALPTLSPIQTAACVAAVAIPTVAVIGKECITHTQKIRDNHGFVQDELNACKNELAAIYQNVADSLESKPVPADLKPKFAVIQNEIQKLGLVKNPAEILGALA